VIYTSLVALMQDDMKKLIAYSSVAHMGFVTIGIFTPNALGLDGSIIQMLSHGIVSAALFMGVGIVYDRLHTHEIDRFGGLVQRMPLYAAIFMLFSLASIGLPGTSGFVGEVLVIVGVFEVNSWVALLAATGGFLSAAYMLWLYRRVIFGALVKDELKLMPDLRPNEIVAFAPLIVLTLLMGIYPDLFLDPMRASVDQLMAQIGATPATELAGR
jgi:NADH-quinone oxidoreductase subunit M